MTCVSSDLSQTKIYKMEVSQIIQFYFFLLYQGIYYSKDGKNGQCNLLPVPSTSEMGHELELFLSNNDNLTLTSNPEEFRVLEGQITDISFIPSVVLDECHSGYRWLAKSAHKGD